jgi:hypothetical protein
LLASVIAAVPAWADTELRLKTQPITDPVQAFVTVTDEGGDPLAGLTAADFGVTLDGVPVVIQPSDLTLPPAQDPNQKISVIFVMDFSTSVVSNALAAMQDAVIAFIDAMNDGDHVAILKFNGDSGASIVQEFVAIDHGVNSAASSLDLLFGLFQRLHASQQFAGLDNLASGCERAYERRRVIHGQLSTGSGAQDCACLISQGAQVRHLDRRG